MKRSETVLVYGVTGILVVILGIAVVFGNDPVAVASTGQDAESGINLANLLDEELLDPGLAGLVPGEGEEGGLNPDLSFGPDQLGPVPAGGKASEFVLSPDAGPLQVALSMKPPPTVDSLFGPSRSVAVGEEASYRVVKVARGDSFSTLVERWCGSSKAYMDDAVALNEQIDISRLPVGTEIWLPWVQDSVLIQAYEERGSRASVPAAASAPGAAAIRMASAAAGNEYELKPGESLWVIAVRQASARQAQSYIDQILELNPRITDPARVRAGMKIILPAR